MSQPSVRRGGSAFAERRISPGIGPTAFAVVFCGYLALAQVVIWLNDPVSAGAGLWPAAGLTVATMLLLPTRLWGWVVAAVVAAELGGDLAHGYPLAASLGWTLGNVVEPLVGAGLMRRWGNRYGLLTPVRQYLVFLGAAVVLGPLVGGTVGAATSSITMDMALVDVWPKYFVGDALGVLVVAPAILALQAVSMGRSLRETLTLGTTALLTTVAVFSDWSGEWVVTMPYLLVPFFAWAAMRYGVRGTAWLALTVTGIANWFTAYGDGPFALAGGPDGHSITLLQVFLAITVATALLMASMANYVGAKERTEQRLRHQATHDPLTGLPNRALLETVLADALDGASEEERSRVGLLVCDVDLFKEVNDTAGHAGGDRLLIEVAARLQTAVRPDDVVARLGGDEFVVVLTDVGEGELHAVAERLLAAVREPVEVAADVALTPSLSIGGVTGCPSASGEELFEHADAALYRAKAGGRGRAVFFDDGQRRHTQVETRIQSDLPGALAARQLYCVFQPEIELATSRVYAFETLVRWQHPEHGLVAPNRILPAVTATGTDLALFQAVLQQAMETQSRWAARLGFRPGLTVNTSPGQLTDPRVVEAVEAALTVAEADPGTLWLEVSEAALLDGTSVPVLNDLRTLGVRLAVDDFGSGAMSMPALSRCAWDMFKIDRRFISALAGDPESEAEAVCVINGMLAVAGGLGVKTLAAGVETWEQLQRVTDLGFDLAQGFYFGSPALPDAAAASVTQQGFWTRAELAAVGSAADPWRERVG